MKNRFDKFWLKWIEKVEDGVKLKRKVLIVLIFMCSLFVSFGVRIIGKDIFYVTVDHIYEYKNKISEEEVYLGDLRKKIELKRYELKEHGYMSGDGEEKIIKYQGEIDKYKTFGGFSDVKGEGVIIVVDDGVRDLIEEEDPLDLIVHDLDVRTLINELFNAGAEAVSINENRIVMGLSEVFCNGPTIRINGVQQSRPYVIKAIGDKYHLAKILLDSESYGVNLMKYGIQYELITGSNIEIGAHKGLHQFKYAKSSEE